MHTTSSPRAKLPKTYSRNYWKWVCNNILQPLWWSYRTPLGMSWKNAWQQWMPKFVEQGCYVKHIHFKTMLLLYFNHYLKWALLFQLGNLIMIWATYHVALFSIKHHAFAHGLHLFAFGEHFCCCRRATIFVQADNLILWGATFLQAGALLYMRATFVLHACNVVFKR